MMSKLLKLFVFAITSFVLAGCATDNHDDATYKYQRYEDQMRKINHFRDDYAPNDALYSNEQLGIDFARIALRSEVNVFTNQASSSKEVTLVKWADPIRYKLSGQINPARQAEIKTYMQRLAKITGHDIAYAPDTASSYNYSIAVLPRSTRQAFIEEFSNKVMSGIKLGKGEQVFLSWFKSIHHPCIVVPRSNGKGIIFASIFFKEEISEGLFTACIHEELAQALGASNDDKRVRPSIFNDDQEFIELTEHDELLLQILYDDRLKTGMDKNTAMPIVRQIISEIRPESAS